MLGSKLPVRCRSPAFCLPTLVFLLYQKGRWILGEKGIIQSAKQGDIVTGGAGRGGAAQHAAGDGADARDRSEHRGALVVDGFLVEIDSAAGIQIVRQALNAAAGNGRVQ